MNRKEKKRSTMDGRWMRAVVVVWLTWIAVARVQAVDEYCTRTRESIRCVYKNTSQVRRRFFR